MISLPFVHDSQMSVLRGKLPLKILRQRARYGAKQLYMYLDGTSAPSDDESEATGLSQAPGFSSDQGLEQQQLTAMVQELQ